MSSQFRSMSPTAKVYFDGLDMNELRYQCCMDCSSVRHPPTTICHKCGSGKYLVRASAGKGAIYSWIIPRKPDMPCPPVATNQVVVVVELDEGIRIIGQYKGGTNPKFGQRVEATLENFGDNKIPMFRNMS